MEHGSECLPSFGKGSTIVLEISFRKEKRLDHVYTTYVTLT